MNIVERVKSLVFSTVFKSEQAEMMRMLEVLDRAYTFGQYALPPDELHRVLKENGFLTSSAMNALASSGFEILSDIAGDVTINRGRALKTAWRMYYNNINIRRAVEIWTDFGMGSKVEVSVEGDDLLNSWIEDFFDDPRNSDILGETDIFNNSTVALNEGELFFPLYFSPIEGKPLIDRYPSHTFEVLFLNKHNKTRPLMFKTQTDRGQLYIPKWSADVDMLDMISVPASARRTDVEGIDQRSFETPLGISPHTLALGVWLKRNIKDGRGMPQFLTSIPWAVTLQNFMGDRAAVARKAAMFTDKVTVDGGSRFLNSMKEDLSSSLAVGTDGYLSDSPGAGSDWIQNDQVNREWMTRDSGANSARFDGRMIGGQLTVGVGVGLHWLGFPDALANRSTAEEIARPFVEQIERYQNWLAFCFKEIARAVIFIRSKYSVGMRREFSSLSEISRIPIKVNLETPSNATFEAIISLINTVGTMVKDGTIDKVTGTIVINEIVYIILSKLNVKNARGKIYNVDLQNSIISKLNPVAQKQIQDFLNAYAFEPDVDLVGTRGGV